MPRNAPAFLLLALLAIGALIVSSGCTAVGFGAGALSDMSRGKGPPSSLWRVRSGVSITMWLRDGRKLDGVFRGHRSSSAGAAAPERPAGTDSLAGPRRAVILVDTKQGAQEIPFDDILRVSVPVASGKVIGTLLGLGLDTLFVLAAFAASGAAY
jgi:hypothetical protein